MPQLIKPRTKPALTAATGVMQGLAEKKFETYIAGKNKVIPAVQKVAIGERIPDRTKSKK